MKTEISEQEKLQAHIDHHRRLLREELAKEKPNETDVINLGWVISCAMHRQNGCETVVQPVGTHDKVYEAIRTGEGVLMSEAWALLNPPMPK